MKLLIAIMTCHQLDYYIDDMTVDWLSQRNLRCTDQQKRVNTIRETWVKDLPPHDPAILQDIEVDYKFFYGRVLRNPAVKPNQRPSTITPKYADRQPASDEIFLNCGDNYTENPTKMKEICRWALKNGYDYVLRCDDDTFIYPDRLLKIDFKRADYIGSGGDPSCNVPYHPGGCVFLSRKAMELIVDAKITTYADDCWMGEVLSRNGIPAVHEPAMYNPGGANYAVKPAAIAVGNYATFHSCKPEVMVELYAKRN